MKILQGGAPKCGNFWLYQILQETLKTSGLDSSSFIEKQPIYELAKAWDLNYPSQAKIDVIDITDLQTSYRISSIFRMPVISMNDYLAQTSHVWTHSPVCKRSEEVFKHFDKKLYIIRGPRDRAISASKYYCSDYMLKYYPQEEKDPQKFLEKNFEALMTEWVWHVFDHLRLSKSCNLHIVFYENLLNNFEAEFSSLLEYLEIHLTAEARSTIEKAVSFQQLKLENPKHLKTGRSGYWREKLSPEQQKTAETIAGPLLKFLGYSGEEEGKPAFSGDTTEEEFDELKHHLKLQDRTGLSSQE